MVGPNFPSLVNSWYLTGATASGKTSVGIPLALKIDAEIISMDSMALYQGMDIGTAKPTAVEREEVRHHLLDIVAPNQEFSIARYLEQVQIAVQDISRRGKNVLFVGGTPLYLKALLQGIDTGPAADWEFRDQVLEEARKVGFDSLHQRLQLVDPLSAAKLPSNDVRRIVRALEYYHLTGRPISHVQLHFEETPQLPAKVFALQWPRAILHERIHRRVEAMFAAGWVQEVEQLLARYQTLSRTAEQAVGYREIIEHLRGRSDLNETIERVRTRTRQFAKRQETWFRSIPNCQFIPCSNEFKASDLATRIAEIGIAESGGRI